MARKPLPTLPTRTPVIDSSGRMSKPWVDVLQGATDTAQTAQATADSAAASASTANAPGNVTALSASGTMDGTQGTITLNVRVSPPTDTGDTFIGAHLYLEIPDQSSAAAQVVGASTVGGAAVTGTWQPVDLGWQPYVAAQQPWTLTLSIPSGVNPLVAVACRIYAVSYSNKVENPLVQAGKAGASPNAAFTITPAPGSTSSAGTSVTATSGLIVATVLTPDNSTGKLMTPVSVMVGSVPTNIPGWCYQIVVTLGQSDPTIAANQFIVTGLETVAGLVPTTSPDGISVPHTFAFPTPATIATATVWLQSGLVDGNGNFNPNPIVPGITPSFPISYGSTTGTVDVSQAIIAKINSTMAVTSGLFGVANSGIATINIQNLAITNPLLASLCVQAANLANGSVTATAIGAAAVGTAAIQNAAITNLLVANAAISGAQIQTATITAANIANLTVGDAQIGTCGISKLLAGTATFSGTATFQYSTTGPQVVISSSGITLSQGSGSTSKLTLTASQAVLTQDGTNGITLNSSGQMSITTNGLSSSFGADGRNGFVTGTIQADEIYLNPGTIHFWTGVSTVGATGSAAPLPAQPVGYINVTVAGTAYKMPYYNP